MGAAGVFIALRGQPATFTATCIRFLHPGSTGCSALVGSRRVPTASARDSTGSVWLRIPGLEEFADERFPSSGVRHEIDLAGFTVVVIGTAGIREAILAAGQSAV